MMPHYVDPTPEKILRMISGARDDVLQRARMTWGDQEDYDAVAAKLNALPADGTLRVVDLSCVQSLGEQARLAPLQVHAKDNPTVLVLRREIAARYPEITEESVAGIITIEESVERAYGIESQSVPFAVHSVSHGFHPDVGTILAATPSFGPGSNWTEGSNALIGDYLARLVCAQGLRVSPDNHRYTLSDGTESNIWLDVKKLISKPENSVQIAYFFARSITADFRTFQKADGTPVPLTLLAGNHTAVAIAAMIRALLGPSVAVAVFDQLGPQAYLTRARIDVMRSLPREVIIIEDVLSSGREVDFIALLALVRRSDVARVVSLYDLEIAHPRLIPANRVIALSRPARMAGYKRTPIVMQPPAIEG